MYAIGLNDTLSPRLLICVKSLIFLPFASQSTAFIETMNACFVCILEEMGANTILIFKKTHLMRLLTVALGADVKVEDT